MTAPCHPLPALLLAAALVPCAAAPRSPLGDSDIPAEFRGIWRAEDGSVLALEPRRAVWVRGSTPVYYRAAAAEDGAVAVLETWARETRLALAREAHLLRVRNIGSESDAVVYTAAPDAAPAVTVPRLGVADPEPLAADRVAEIQAELRARAEHDQALRKSNQPADNQELGRLMREASERDAKYVRELLETVGWIDPARFGERAAGDAFLLVQHASHDLPLMSTVLPLLEAGVAEGAVDGQQFALMHDRLQLALGYLQRYGSQLGTAEDGVLVLMPLEDPAAVDARRAELGMGPLASYLALFGDPDGIRLPPGLVLGR